MLSLFAWLKFFQLFLSLFLLFLKLFVLFIFLDSFIFVMGLQFTLQNRLGELFIFLLFVVFGKFTDKFWSDFEVFKFIFDDFWDLYKKMLTRYFNREAGFLLKKWVLGLKGIDECSSFGTFYLLMARFFITILNSIEDNRNVYVINCTWDFINFKNLTIQPMVWLDNHEYKFDVREAIFEISVYLNKHRMTD